MAFVSVFLGGPMSGKTAVLLSLYRRSQPPHLDTFVSFEPVGDDRFPTVSCRNPVCEGGYVMWYDEHGDIEDESECVDCRGTAWVMPGDEYQGAPESWEKLEAALAESRGLLVLDMPERSFDLQQVLRACKQSVAKEIIVSAQVAPKDVRKLKYVKEYTNDIYELDRQGDIIRVKPIQCHAGAPKHSLASLDLSRWK